MINSCEIRNFRCFSHLKLAGLRRFTFLVGGSGSGKTAFLESLFLAAGSNPEIYFRVRGWRGFGGNIRLSGTRGSYEELFRDVFHNFDQKSGLTIRFDDSERGYRSLAVFYGKQETYSLPFKGKSLAHAFFIEPINFKWENPDRVINSQIEISEGELKMTGYPDVYPIVLISPQTLVASENAQKFSELSKRKKSKKVIAALQQIFPEVEDITLENVAGDPMLHVSLAGMSERLPIVDLSAGINKYLSIVLAILVNPGGAVLVDEIENGFYYDNLRTLLASIISICEEQQVQLIASTHSYEFLQSIASVTENAKHGEKDFALVRFQRGSNGLNVPLVRVVQGTSYKAAIEQSAEVR